MTTTLRRVLGTGVAVASLAALGACSSVTYDPTAVPTKAPTTSSSPPAVAAQTCDDATRSYTPLPSLPSRSEITDAGMRDILRRGYLRVGVSADTYLFGANDPATGQIRGFDIDVARAVADAIFGDPGKVQLRVITAADRIPLLEKGEIDLVARNMSMTCDRWQKIAFSAEYFRSGQKVLVGRTLPGAATLSLQDLTGKRVCAPTGTTSLTRLRQVSGPVVVTAPTHTACLVLFQQGKADAITGDDTVLAGLAAQDPNTVVTKAPAITVEPYGLGMPKDDVYLARYVNRVLADLEASGGWTRIYDRWLRVPLGPAPKPPTPVYGRA